MGLLQYDKTLDEVSETTVDRGMIVMDAIGEDDLDQLRAHLAQTEGAAFREACRSAPQYRPRQNTQTFAAGDDSEEAVFAFGCK
jgi:hypothetical protein